MPCHSETIDEGPRYARMLCYLCGEMEAGKDFAQTVQNHPELRDWWDEHKREDKRRMDREADSIRIANAKRSALGKLSTEERILLGFHRE